MNRYEITVFCADGESVAYSGLFTGSVDAVCCTLDLFPDARKIDVQALQKVSAQ